MATCEARVRAAAEANMFVAAVCEPETVERFKLEISIEVRFQLSGDLLVWTCVWKDVVVRFL